MKRLGCCTLCDCECFEVTHTYTKGMLAGQPRSLGAPLDKAQRVHVVFMDGTTGYVTSCDECKVEPENLPAIDYRCRELAAMQSTNGKREHWGTRVGPLTLKQQWLHGAQHLKATGNPILGVLFVESWKEAMEREYGRTEG